MRAYASRTIRVQATHTGYSAFWGKLRRPRRIPGKHAVSHPMRPLCCAAEARRSTIRTAPESPHRSVTDSLLIRYSRPSVRRTANDGLAPFPSYPSAIADSRLSKIEKEEPVTAKCAYHPDRVARGACEDCATPLCPECQTRAAGKTLCPRCADRARPRTEAPAPSMSPSVTPSPAPSLAPPT